MHSRREILAAAVALAPLSLAVTPTGARATAKESETADFLFVQNAKAIAFADDRLTLKGVNPVTVMFSDRPERIAGHMTTARFVPFWSEGRDSFLADPPNATLSFLEAKDLADVVVVLHDPVLDGEDLTYRVTLLEGELPATGGSASLFIDIIGMPLTPLSVAGVGRRSFRRAVIY